MKSKRTISTLRIVALAGFICCSAAPWSVHAAAFTVDSNTDVVDANPGDGVCDDGAGNCTLRAAIMEANALAGDDTISLPAGTYTLTITGVDERCDGTVPCTGTGTPENPYLPVVTADASIGDLDITSNLVITGAGPDATFVQWGAVPSEDNDPLTGDRVFHIQTDGANIDSVVIEELTVENGEVGLLPTDAGTVGTPNDYDIDIVDDTAGSVTIWQFRRMGGAIGLGASNAIVLYEESVHGPGGGGGGGGGGTTQTPIAHDHDIELSSVAGEWEKQLSDDFSAVAGASWNRQTRADADDTDAWAYLVGARYEISGNARLRGSYARQIRFPTLRDLYEIERGNPALETEKTDNIELGLEVDFPDERSSIEFVLYRVDAKDFIERGLSGVAENFEKLRFQGFELNGGYATGENLKIRLGYTYLDSENRGPNAATTAVQNRPTHKLNLRLDYDIASGTRLYGAYLYVADALALSRTMPVETMPVGEYSVIDLGASQSLWVDRLRLVGRIENLLDEDYQQSFGFPQPGRRFYLGAEFRL